MSSVHRCPRCAEVKPLTQFYRTSASRGGRPAECKACKAAYQRRRYREDGAKRERLKEAKRAQQRALDALKARPCADCGVQYPPCAMEFDHVRGDKRYGITAIRMSRPDLADELAKCELRCSNCHRIRHARERGTL